MNWVVEYCSRLYVCVCSRLSESGAAAAPGGERRSSRSLLPSGGAEPATESGQTRVSAASGRRVKGAERLTMVDGGGGGGGDGESVLSGRRSTLPHERPRAHRFSPRRGEVRRRRAVAQLAPAGASEASRAALASGAPVAVAAAVAPTRATAASGAALDTIRRMID